MLVSALQVTALLFALPVYAWMTKQGLTRREWAWAILLAAAVAIFVAVGEPAAGYQRASLQAWAVVAMVLGWAATVVGPASARHIGDPAELRRRTAVFRAQQKGRIQRPMGESRGLSRAGAGVHRKHESQHAIQPGLSRFRYVPRQAFQHALQRTSPVTNPVGRVQRPQPHQLRQSLSVSCS